MKGVKKVGLLTIEEAIQKLKIDQKTLYNWRKYEGLPSIKIKKIVYIREEALNEWLLAKETTGV